jgi:hypothetical protein
MLSLLVYASYRPLTGIIWEEGILMTVQDARRKIKLLRWVKPEYGAFQAEAENAERMKQLLMERYAIGEAETAEPARVSPAPLSWVYWEALLGEFGLKLRRFGGRGNATLGRDKIIYIKLHTGQWWIEQPRGLETRARDRGVESLRAYLVKNAPRPYTIFQR